MTHISILAYPDCTASGIYGTIDAFALANLLHKQMGQDTGQQANLFNWDIVSIDGQPVDGEGRALITPHCSIKKLNRTDFILIPAFLPPLRFLGNVPNMLTKWIHSQYENNVMIGAFCTGTFLLAETGLLDGKTVTTNLKLSKHFQRLYPQVKVKPERILTKDSGFVCAGSTTSFLDLCLYLIEKFGNEELSRACAYELLKEPRQSQAPYYTFDFQKNHLDNTIEKAQYYIEEKFTDAISVENLASIYGISTRHFVRRFKNATGYSPLQYLQRIRIEAAKHKLEKTEKSISEITYQVGYQDLSSFRKLFRKNTGLSPGEYRNRFSRHLKPIPKV